MTSMSALILQLPLLTDMVALKLRSIGLQLRESLDAYAAARMRPAVPQWQGRAQREFEGCRPLAHADRR